MNKITADTIDNYINSLKKKDYSSELLDQKINSVLEYLRWGYDKDLLEFSQFQQLKDKIANFQATLEDSLHHGAQKATETPELTSNPKNGPLARYFDTLHRLPLLNWLHRDSGVNTQSNIPYTNGGNQTLNPRFYVGLAFTMLIFAILGSGIYQQFFNTTDRIFAYPSSPSAASRILSFQGRLTDSLGNPITAATNMRFRLYTASSGGTTLYDSGTCSITPDQDGVHNVLIGSDCGSEVASSVFTENTQVWMGVTVGSDSEMTPRQRIANVPYAINAETLQGLPVGTEVSNIPYINAGGDLLIAAASPQIHSTYTNQDFLVSSARAITIQAAGAGNVALTATESGTITFATGGSQHGVITNGGLFGFGTTGPDAKLDVLYTGGEQLRLTYADGSTYSSFTTNSGGDLTIDPSGDDLTIGGDLILSDTFTVQVGGKTATAYNAFANSGDAPEDASIAADNDVYIGGDLEVDGSIIGSITASALPWSGLTAPAADLTVAMAAYNSTFTWDPAADATETAFTLNFDGEDSSTDQDQVLLALNQTSNGTDVTEAADALLTFANSDANDPVDNAIRFDAGAAGTDFTYGINFDAASIGTAEIVLQNAETISNAVDGTIALGGNTDVSGTLYAGTADAFQVDTSGNITTSGTLAVNGDTITSDADLTINPAGGQVIFADSDTFNIGGLTGVAYNAISDSGTTSHSLASDDDLYVEGDLEIDGTLYADGTLSAADLACADCLDFDSFENTLDIDETTDINLGTNNLTIDLDSSGIFDIRDGSTTFVSFDDDSTIDITFPAAGTIGIDAAATDNTTTAGVVNLDVDTATDGNIGQSIDYQVVDAAGNVTGYGEKIDLTIDSDAGQSHTVNGSYIGITANDASSTTYGLHVVGEDAGGQVVTAGVLIENLQATDIDLTTGLLVRATTDGSLPTAIDVSDGEITTALAFGANDIDGTSFDVTGSTGNITTAGDIAVNGGDITSTATTFNFDIGNTGTLNFRDGSNALVAIKDQGVYPFLNLAGKTDTGDPGSCAEGDIYYNDTDDTIKICHESNTWEALDGGAVASQWTDSGTTVYLTDTTDEVVVGGSSPLSSAKVSIDGDADQIQFIVQGNGTQTTNLATFEQSDGTDVVTITNAGLITTASDLAVNGDDITADGALTLNSASYIRVGDSGTPGSANGDDDLYVEGDLELDGVLYLDGTLDTTFTAGSVVFAGTNGVLAQDNSNFFWDDTNNKLGLGDTTPDAKLEISGAATGKALVILNETGDQDIIAASTSGTTRFRVNNDGTVYGGYFADISNTAYGIDPAGTSNFGGYSLKITGGALLGYDSGNVGIGDQTPDTKLNVQATTEQLRLDYDDSNYTSFTVSSGGDITLAPTGGDTNITGNVALTGDLAVNGDDITADGALTLNSASYIRVGDSGTPGSANGDDDLYVEGDLELDGVLYLDGTLDTTFTAGSVVFAGTNGVLAQDNSNFFWDDSSNELGLSDTTPDATLDITDTTEQLRLSYETGDTNYASFTLGSGGDLTIAPSGGDIAFTGNGDFSGGLNAGSSNFFNVNTTGNVGIGTTASSGYAINMAQTTDPDGTPSNYAIYQAITHSGSATGSINQYGNGIFVTDQATYSSGGTNHYLNQQRFTNNSTSWSGYSALGNWTSMNGNANVSNNYLTGNRVDINNGASNAGTGHDYTGFTAQTTNYGTGTIANWRGFSGNISNSSTGVITNAYQFMANSPTNASGTITTAYGMHIADQSVGTNTTAYGLYIANQAGASGNAIGIYVADADDYSLQLASTDGDAASGITFGTDTNLYRNGANSLHTDDSFDLDGSITADGDLAVNGDDITADGALTLNSASYIRVGDSGTPGSANGDDDLYVEGDLEVDGVLYLDGTLDTTFTAGSVVFAGTNGVLAQDNSNFFWDDSSNELTIGGTSADSPLHVFSGSAGTVSSYSSVATFESSGSTYVSILSPDANERGLLFGEPTSSTAGGLIYNASGTTDGWQFRVNGNNTAAVLTSGNSLGVNTTGPDAIIDALATSGEQLRLTYTDSSAYTGFTVSSGGDLTVNATGSQVLLGDADTLNIGGITGAAYNAISDSGTTSHSLASDDDLYVEGDFEVDGTLWADGAITAVGTVTGGDFACTDCLDFPELEDTLDLDASLTLNQSTNTWTQNFTGDTTTGLTYNANSITTGTAVAINSTATSFSSGTLLSLDWSPGSLNTNADDLFKINTTNNGNMSGYYINLLKESSSVFNIAQTGNVTTSGDIAVNGDDITSDGTLVIDAATDIWLDADGADILLRDGGSTFATLTNSSTDLTIAPTGGDVIVTGNILPTTDDTYDLGSNANRWKDIYLGPDTLHIGTSTSDEGTFSYTTSTNVLNIGGTGDLAIDMTGDDVTSPDRFTIGSSTAGVGKLTVTGAETGKALAIFNETGDQNIITASASGSTAYALTRDGDVTQVNDAGALNVHGSQYSLAPNASFEVNSDGDITMPDAWFTKAGTPAWTIGSAANGDNYMELTNYLDQAISACFPVGQETAGGTNRTYTISLWYGSSYAGVGSVLRWGIYTYTSRSDCQTDTSSANPGFIAVNPGNTNKWSYSSGTITPADSETWARVWLLNNDSSDTAAQKVDGVLVVPTTITAGLDLAETYPSAVSDGIKIGEIVAFGTDEQQSKADVKNIKRSTKPYDNLSFGVVATKPGLLLDDLEQYEKVQVALKGRVPVLVTTENGPIKVGDPITASSKPGVGMKATRSGKIIGYAMTEWTSSDPNEVDQVTVFVNPETYVDLSILTDLQEKITKVAQSTMATTGQFFANSVTAINATIDNLIVDRIISQEITAKKIDTEDLIAQKITTESITTQDLQAKDASISGKLVAQEIDADNIRELRERLERISEEQSSQPDFDPTQLQSEVEDIQQYLAELPEQQPADAIPLQEISANSSIDPGTSFSVTGEVIDMLNVDKLTVTGQATMTSLMVADSLTAGNILVKDNGILSLNNELKLSALEQVLIMDGAVIIARNGTITAKGEVIAEKGVRTNTLRPLDNNATVGLQLSQNKVEILNNNTVVAAIDDNGSARFSDVSLDTYTDATNSAAIIAAEDTYESAGILSPAIQTNAAAAGNGILPAQNDTVVIFNEKITPKSLVYVTATSKTYSQNLYVAEKKSCTQEERDEENCKPFFTVHIDGVIKDPLTFNWWIVN